MWIVSQIGAREHYAIPRALHACGELDMLITEFWIPPSHFYRLIPGAQRLRDRFHTDLEGANVRAPDLRMLSFELKQRVLKRCGWPLMMARNRIFQKQAIPFLREWESRTDRRAVPHLFSYSYAARDLFRHTKKMGWKTVLGQIDPGPEEERIVAEEHLRYPQLASSWQPAPASYWDSWREELELADRIIVNSEWSRECLLKEGVPAEKMEVVPLVYGNQHTGGRSQEAVGNFEVTLNSKFKIQNSRPLSVLFLGQILLRKGIGRLLDAMRMLKDDPIELTLVGASQIDERAWRDLPNVRYAGPLPRSEVGKYYASSDVFVLPTLSDGYALTQLEALSHGLPVIASRFCGSVVQDGVNGRILPDLEPATIAEILRSAVSYAGTWRSNIATVSDFSLSDLADVLLDKKPRFSSRS